MHCTQWSRELARVGCDVTLTSWQQWRHSVQRCCCYDNGGGCLAEYSANEKRQRHDRCRGTIHVVHYSGPAHVPPKLLLPVGGTGPHLMQWWVILSICWIHAAQPRWVTWIRHSCVACSWAYSSVARVDAMRGCAYSWIFNDGQGQGALNWIDDIDGWVQQTCHNVIMALCACVSNPRNGQPALSSLVSTLLW